MRSLACLWNRPRLERYIEFTLGARATGRVQGHLGRCALCAREVERLRRLRALVQSAVPEPADPDWSSFWHEVHARILSDRPRRFREPWWLPLWKPIWAHPRFAIGGVLAAAITLSLSLWPGSDGGLPAAWAGPVQVQDVETPDPDRSVMVYSSADHGLTVIWVFAPDAGSDDS